MALGIRRPNIVTEERRILRVDVLKNYLNNLKGLQSENRLKFDERTDQADLFIHVCRQILIFPLKPCFMQA